MGGLEMNIAVYAASGSKPASAYHEAASRLGRLIAQGGHTMIYGGGSSGLMGDCAGAALEASGKVIGIAPRFFDEDGMLLHSCTELFYTNTIAERKTAMEDMADAFIILPGGIGTMEEFFETYTLKQLGMHSKPIALINTLGFYEPIRAFLRSAADGGFMGSGCLELVRFCESPEQAVEYAVSAPKATGNLRRLQDYGK